MKRFLLNSISFALPFLLLFALIIIIDPFGYFNIFTAIPPEIKKSTAYRLNYALWKTIEYSKKPCANILLGDSRMERFKPEKIKEFTDVEYYNFSYGGGTLAEACKTFWFAAEITKLKNVYIGINFNLYNMHNSGDRVSGAMTIMKNPLLYLVNRDVVKAAFMIVKHLFSGKSVSLEAPPMSRARFWEYQLNVTAKRYYKSYAYPTSLYEELNKISAYCDDKKIKLVFLILPTHVSLQKKVQAFGLQDAQQRFLSDLQGLGTVYDFDYPNPFTENRSNFNDPYHFKPDEHLSLFIKEIWHGVKGYAKVYSLHN